MSGFKPEHLAKLSDHARRSVMRQIHGPGRGFAVPSHLPPARVLAFDPGSRDVGWGVIDRQGGRLIRRASGCWHPSARAGAGDRFDQLARYAHSLAGQYAPTVAAVEVPSGGQRWSATQLMVYARAIGVIEAALALAGLPPVRVTVNGWKGTDKKTTTEVRVTAALGYRPATDHEADALGVGIHVLSA